MSPGLDIRGISSVGGRDGVIGGSAPCVWFAQIAGLGGMGPGITAWGGNVIPGWPVPVVDDSVRFDAFDICGGG